MVNFKNILKMNCKRDSPFSTGTVPFAVVSYEFFKIEYCKSKNATL